MVGSTDKQSKTYSFSGYVPIQEPPSGPQVSDYEADNKAKAKLISMAREAQSSFQGGTFLGELRETVRMLKPKQILLKKSLITDYLPRLEDRASRLFKRRRGITERRKALGQLPKELADVWLEYSFGVRPLVADIQDGAHELARYFTYKPPSKDLRAGFKSKKVIGTFGWSQSIGGVYLSAVNEISAEVDVRYIGQVRLTPVSTPLPRSQSFVNSLGFTMSEFLPTLWELTPYSFLVDYFTNIGDMISSFSYPKSNFSYLVRGTKWSNKSYCHSAQLTQDVSDEFWSKRGSGSPGFSTFERFGVVRTDWMDKDLQVYLDFHVPEFLGQYVNMTALGVANAATRRRISRL